MSAPLTQTKLMQASRVPRDRVEPRAAPTIDDVACVAASPLQLKVRHRRSHSFHPATAAPIALDAAATGAVTAAVPTSTAINVTPPILNDHFRTIAHRFALSSSLCN